MHDVPLPYGCPQVAERPAVPQKTQTAAMESALPECAEARWMRMAGDPMLVREARAYAARVLARAGVGDRDFVEDVRLVVSELVTNAMRAAERFAVVRGVSWASYERPVALRVECRPAWAHLFVIDPDPRMAEPAARDFLDEGGRGITIIESVGALHWYVPGTYGKTVHAVITRPGVRLTPVESGQLLRRVIV